MPGINTEMDSLTKDIEKASKDLELLYVDLGKKAVGWHRAIAYKPSNESYQKICVVLEEREKILLEIEKVKNALSDVSNSDTEIRKTQLTLTDLEKKLSVLITSLGAVAVEVERAGKLPENMKVLMEDFHNYQAQEHEIAVKMASSKGLSKALLEEKYKRHQKTLESVFEKVGTSVFNSGLAMTLPSEKAKALVNEAQDINNMIVQSSDAIDNKKNLIDEAQSSLEQMGVLGAENRHLKTLEAQDKQVLEKLDDLYEDYGKILASGIDVWLDLLAPEELQASCCLIRDQKRRIKEQKLSFELLSTEKEIEVHQGQTELLASQLSHLNSQLALIERQKTDIQIKIETEKKTLEELKEKQDKINSMF